MYKINVIEKMVHEWSNENGEGDYIHTVTVDMEKELKELSVNGIAEAINEVLYLYNHKVSAGDVKEFIEFMEDTNQDFFNVAIIENADGEEDIDGKYICDYMITIEKINTVNYQELKQLS